MSSTHHPITAALTDYLRELSESRFWGSITLKFESGQVVHARREENLKPSELSGKRCAWPYGSL